MARLIVALQLVPIADTFSSLLYKHWSLDKVKNIILKIKTANKWNDSDFVKNIGNNLTIRDRIIWLRYLREHFKNYFYETISTQFFLEDDFYWSILYFKMPLPHPVIVEMMEMYILLNSWKEFINYNTREAKIAFDRFIFQMHNSQYNYEMNKIILPTKRIIYVPTCQENVYHELANTVNILRPLDNIHNVIYNSLFQIIKLNYYHIHHIDNMCKIKEYIKQSVA